MNRTHIVDNLSQYEEVNSNITQQYEVIQELEEREDFFFIEAAHPEPYSEGDPKSWLRQYELIAKGNGWNEEMKARKLICYLKGASRIWYIEHVNHDSPIEWAALKEIFINKFTNKMNSFNASMKIQKRRQNEGESLETYWFAKLQLINSLNPKKCEEDKMNEMIDGMKPSLRKRVRTHVMIFPCNNLEELYDLAKSFSDEDNESEDNDSESDSRNINFKSSHNTNDFKIDLASLKRSVTDLKSVFFYSGFDRNNGESGSEEM